MGGAKASPPDAVARSPVAQPHLSDLQLETLARTTWTTGLAAALALRMDVGALSAPLHFAFTLSLTLLSYVKSVMAHARGKAAWLHPIVSTTAGTVAGLWCVPGPSMAATVPLLLHPVPLCDMESHSAPAARGFGGNRHDRAFGVVSGTGFHPSLSSYLSTTGAWGAGNLLTFLLGPVVISFGLEM